MAMKLMSTHRQNKKGTKKSKLPILQLPCTDMVSPKKFKSAVQNLPTSAIFLKSAIWRPGQKGKITITFGDQMCAGCDPSAAWSQIGSNSTGEYPSMNLGFMDPPFKDFSFNGKTYKFEEFESAMRNYCNSSDSSSCWEGWSPGCTVIHEFGHALGMMHEHQNNLFESNEINLDHDAVIKYYKNIGMSEAEATVNVIDRYECNAQKCEYSGSKYDPKSIMLYYLPDDWVIGENPTYPNFVLSATDKEWLRINYPMSNKAVEKNGMPEITIEFVDNGAPAWKEAWVQKMVIEDLIPIIGINMRFIGSEGGVVTVKPQQSIARALRDDNISLSKERNVLKRERANKKTNKTKKRVAHQKKLQDRAIQDIIEDTFSPTGSPVEFLDVTDAPVGDFSDITIDGDDEYSPTYTPIETMAPISDDYIDEEEEIIEDTFAPVYEDVDVDSDEEDLSDLGPDDVPLKLLCSIERFGNTHQSFTGGQIFGIVIGSIALLIFLWVLFNKYFPDSSDQISRIIKRPDLNLSSYTRF